MSYPVLETLSRIASSFSGSEPAPLMPFVDGEGWAFAVRTAGTADRRRTGYIPPMLLLLACTPADPPKKESPPSVEDSQVDPTTRPTDTGGFTQNLVGEAPDSPVSLPQFQATNRDGSLRYPTRLVGHPTALVFLPDLTGGSTVTELRAFEERLEQFEILQVQVVGVTFEPPSASEEMATQRRLDLELWTDDQKTLALTYGAIASTEEVTPHRRTVLLDPDGALFLVYDPVNVVTGAASVLNDADAVFGR